MPEYVIRSVPEWAKKLDPASRIAAARGILDLDGFFTPGKKKFAHPCEALPDAARAAEVLADAVRNQKKVLVWGDYDCDGVCACAIMDSFLEGRCPHVIHLPERSEGYGMHLRELEKACADFPPDVLFTVDCGIASGKEAAWAREQGVTVVVTDHHRSESKPPADVVVDPILEDCGEYHFLCGAGLAWLVCSLAEDMLESKKSAGERRNWLLYAGVATIADVVPLEGASRFLARRALALLGNCMHPGIRRVMSERSRKGTVPASDVEFLLGPAINASGRMDSPRHAFEMLRGAPEIQARGADACLRLNAMRKRKEAEIATMVMLKLHEERRVVTADCGPGLVGLIAGRISRQTGKPVIVLCDRGGFFAGSGRAPEGYPLLDMVRECSDLLLGFGGHSAACGCSLEAARLREFRQRFSDIVDSFPVETRPVEVDMELGPRELTLDLLADLYRMEPFGQGNPRPLFLLRDAAFSNAVCRGVSGQHLLFSVEAGGLRFKGKMWDAEEMFPEFQEGRRRDILFHLTEPYGEGNRPEIEVACFADA